MFDSYSVIRLLLLIDVGPSHAPAGVLCRRSQSALSRSCANGVLSICIDVLKGHELPEAEQYALLMLIRMLAVHSTDRKSAGQLLHLSCDRTGAISPHVQLELVNTVAAAAEVTSPPVYYDFNGSHDRLVLPEFELPSSGYSVHIWVRIETLGAGPRPKVVAAPVISKFRHPTASSGSSKRSALAAIQPRDPAYPAEAYLCESASGSSSHGTRPTLFTLTSTSGARVEAFFTAGRLAVRILNTGRGNREPYTHVFAATAVPVGRWTAVALSHSPGKGLLTAAELKLYIDGRLRVRAFSACCLLSVYTLPRLASAGNVNQYHKACGQMQ